MKTNLTNYGISYLLALGLAGILAAAPVNTVAADGHWVTTWGCGPQLTEPGNLPSATMNPAPPSPPTVTTPPPASPVE